LIEGVHVEPAANNVGGDVRLEIRKRQDEIGPQGEDLVDIRRVNALTRGFSRRACGGRTI
jgi:hypothetical protein